MWQMYDELISGVPEHLQVQEVFQSQRKSVVVANESVGGAMIYEGPGERLDLAQFKDKKLRDVAQLVKSWHFPTASLGLAALNCYYNQMPQLEMCPRLRLAGDDDIFKDFFRRHAATEKIGVVGHFMPVDEWRKKYPHVYVFELEPRLGDYPFSAEEFLLPEMDWVYVTGSALVNKTLPRILALAKNAQVSVVGASTTLSPILFDYGVTELAGTLLGSSINYSFKEVLEDQINLYMSGTPIVLRERGKTDENEK